MDDNFSNFIHSGHGHLTSLFGNPPSRTNLTFKEALVQPSTTYTEASHDIASFQCLTQWNLQEGVSSPSAGESDNFVASFSTGSFGFQEQCNTESSSSLTYGDINNLIAGNYDSSSDLIREGAPLLTSQGNMGVGRIEPYNLDNSLGHIFDPALGYLSSNVSQNSTSSFDGSHFAFESTQAGGESMDYGFNLSGGSNLGQHPQQRFLSELPEITDVSFPLLNSLSDWNFASQPSDPTSTYTVSAVPSAIDPWDGLRPTYPNGMATEVQHSDEPAIKTKPCKAGSKSRQVRDIKTYSCSVCRLFSGDVKSLREHMRCHEKTHACAVLGCAQSFSTSRDLTRHVKSAHSNTFLTCSFCFVAIKGNRTDNLWRHIKTRHSAQALAVSSPSYYSSWSSPGHYTSM